MEVRNFINENVKKQGNWHRKYAEGSRWSIIDGFKEKSLIGQLRKGALTLLLYVA